MKIKNGFMLRAIAGQWVVVPIGERTIEFNAIITLSDTGAFLWKQMENDVTTDELINRIVNEYDIDYKSANLDTIEFLDQLKVKGLIENEQ